MSWIEGDVPHFTLILGTYARTIYDTIIEYLRGTIIWIDEYLCRNAATGVHTRFVRFRDAPADGMQGNCLQFCLLINHLRWRLNYSGKLGTSGFDSLSNAHVDLDAASHQVVMESLELAHHGLRKAT